MPRTVIASPLFLAIALLAPGCIETGTLREGTHDPTGESTGGGVWDWLLGGRSSGGSPEQSVGGQTHNEQPSGGRTQDPSSSSGASGGIPTPGKGEPDERFLVYSFKAGSWRVAAFDSSNQMVVDSDGEVGEFGRANDIPFLWKPHTGAKILHIGTYRTRDGSFLLDRDGDVAWNEEADSQLVFLEPEPYDKPFILTANYYIQDSDGSCIQLSGPDDSGPMVGIKRASMIYLDRTGDGVFTEGSCDLSGSLGSEFDTPFDIPSGVPGREGVSYAGEDALALVQKSGNRATWFYDSDLDLRFDSWT